MDPLEVFISSAYLSTSHESFSLFYQTMFKFDWIVSL